MMCHDYVLTRSDADDVAKHLYNIPDKLSISIRSGGFMALTDEQKKTVDTYLEEVKQQIIATAEEVAAKNGGKIDTAEVGSILSEFARTKPIPITQSAWAQIISVPGIVWISTLLTVTFGVLSVWYPALSDLAKVFAGAIVGASGASSRR
jgi:hypothetical protein